MFELSIGGLRFQAEVASDIILVEDDRNYREFVHQAPVRLGEARLGEARPGEVIVPVSIEVGGAPDVEALPTLFEAGTWSAHRGGGEGEDAETILRLRTEEGYLWVARITSCGDQDRVHIHCGSLLVDGRRVRSPLHYPLDQLLTMYILAARQGLICHAAGFSIDGRGLLFAGRSGAGKTTFMGLASGLADIEGLSDDRVIPRRVDDSVLVYGTPWAGEGQVAENRAVPLEALIFLHQATENELRRISVHEALAQLFPVVSVLWFDRPRMERATAFCGELVESLPCYELHFCPGIGAIDLVRRLLGSR